MLKKSSAIYGRQKAMYAVKENSTGKNGDLISGSFAVTKSQRDCRHNLSRCASIAELSSSRCGRLQFMLIAV